MRVEYVVEPVGSEWHVRRGHTVPLVFDTTEKATKAATRMAQAAADNGETALVQIIRGSLEVEVKTFPAAGYQPKSAAKPLPRVRGLNERTRPQKAERDGLGRSGNWGR
jgi:hypothetical protein